MTGGCQAQSLGPREEITLRRIALGYAERSDLPATHIHHLEQLGLIAERNGGLTLTPDGRRRYDALARPLGLAHSETPDELLRLLNMLVAQPRL